MFMLGLNTTAVGHGEHSGREILERELRPRLCLTKGDRGYGFHLHGERNRGAQFIRKIEPGSTADLSGLRTGDRLVEVNGENVEERRISR